MENLRKIDSEWEEWLYKTKPDTVDMWNKIREIVEWINKQEGNHGR